MVFTSLSNPGLRLIHRLELYCDGTLDTLLEELTAIFVNAVDVSCSMVGISSTTARAVELCPAVLAFRSGVCAA